MIESPKIAEKDKKFLIKQSHREQTEQAEEELDRDFEGFNGGLDYNSRKIDLLQDLRNMAKKALENIKKIDDLSSHPERKRKLDNDYEFYCKWYEAHAQHQPQPEQAPGDDISIFAMPAHLSGLMSKERFEKKIFNVEFTTFHYSFFNYIAEKWKCERNRRRGFEETGTRKIEIAALQ